MIYYSDMFHFCFIICCSETGDTDNEEDNRSCVCIIL